MNLMSWLYIEAFHWTLTSWIMTIMHPLNAATSTNTTNYLNLKHTKMSRHPRIWISSIWIKTAIPHTILCYKLSHSLKLFLVSLSILKIKIELAPAHDVTVDGFLELMKKSIQGRWGGGRVGRLPEPTHMVPSLLVWSGNRDPSVMGGSTGIN